MWQDALVTMIAIGALALIGRRWFGARRRRASAAPGCANCAHGSDRGR